MMMAMRKQIWLVVVALLCTQGSWAEEEDSRQVPTSFVRDVMQPLGMPTVTFFHAIRENLFLNTKLKHPNPLERIGNFFLIPSQYLFAGKKISFTDENTVEIKQAYSYRKWHAFKSLLCLAALPVSETLGITFKGLSFLSSDVRKKHRAAKIALTTPSTSNLDLYRSQGVSSFHTDEFIPCLDLKRPSKLTKKQKIELQALKDVMELLDAHQVLYWIDCGTALGAYRYGGIIPWDWDIDLSIILSDHDLVKQILSNLDPEKYQIQDWSSYSNPKTFMKLYVKETKNFVDIYHYQIHEKEGTMSYFFTYENSPFPHSWKAEELKCMKPLKIEEIFPLKQARFDGLVVRAPHDIVTFLQSKYGENLSPVMAWIEETQTFEKVLDHPYWRR